MTTRNREADRRAAIESCRLAGQASKAVRKLDEKRQQLADAVKNRCTKPARQNCDTANGAPPLPWQRAFNLAKTHNVGFIFLSELGMASVEVKRNTSQYCATPSAAEQAIRMAAAGVK